MVRIPSGATAADAAVVIVGNDVGVVVIGAESRPSALSSERDVARVVAAAEDSARVSAREAGSTHLVWCAASDTVVDTVATRMTERLILVGALTGNRPDRFRCRASQVDGGLRGRVVLSAAPIVECESSADFWPDSHSGFTLGAAARPRHAVVGPPG